MPLGKDEAEQKKGKTETNDKNESIFEISR